MSGMMTILLLSILLYSGLLAIKADPVLAQPVGLLTPSGPVTSRDQRIIPRLAQTNGQIAWKGSTKMTVPKPPTTKALSSDDDPVTFQKIRGWANKPRLNVHSIIALAVRHTPISQSQLVADLEKLEISKNPYGAIASLKTNKGNAYGMVFVEDELGRLSFHPDIRIEIAKHRWIVKL